MSGKPQPSGAGAASPVSPVAPADLIRPEILAMAAYHVPDATGLVKLDAMENPYRLPEALRQALGARLAEVAINRYPAPTYARLKRLIRERFDVPAGSELVLGNGSDELITLLTVAIARPGATVVAPVPAFVMYEVSARLAGVRFVPVSLAADFSIDLPRMLEAIAAERPAIVWLPYPNNPTGNCFDERAIAAILAAAPGLVVVDEAYQPFALDTWMPRLPADPRLLVMRTVSKLGLAGLRVGFLAGAPQWIAELEKLRPPYNVGVLNEAAAEFALEHLDVLDEQAALLRAERERLLAELARIPGVQPFPTRANFVLLRVAGASAVAARMRELGVLIKDVGRMHPLLADCLRVTVGTPQENRLMLEALAAAVGKPR